MYIFHMDPGHGWLEVAADELKRLNISDQISSYSYMKDGKVYLEEDCDATKFVDAKHAIGEKVWWKEKYADHTPIRNYASYRAPT